jgi:hypothetical protein
VRTGAELGKASGVSYLQAFIIAVVQGVTKLFPVSSLGHLVLIPGVGRWHLGNGWCRVEGANGSEPERVSDRS